MTASPSSTTIDTPTGDRTEALARPGGAVPLGNRLVAVVLFVCCGGLLGLAAFLTPADAGMGTHMQMGLPACGFKEVTGYPCATCGCTTAFAHAANGSLLDALIVQPFGAVLAVGVAMVTLITGWSAVSGMSLAPLGRVAGSKAFNMSWIGLLLLAWGYKSVVVVFAG